MQYFIESRSGFFSWLIFVSNLGTGPSKVHQGQKVALIGREMGPRLIQGNLGLVKYYLLTMVINHLLTGMILQVLGSQRRLGKPTKKIICLQKPAKTHENWRFYSP